MRLAKRAKNLTDTTVIDLLKVAADPAIISFAGGVPSPLTFPLPKFAQISRHLFGNPQCFQYQPTQGITEFLNTLTAYLSFKWQRKIKPENILIISGSQQGIDLLGKTFIDPGNRLVVERPAYFVALQAFSAYQPKFIDIDFNNNYLNLVKLKKILLKKPKLVYLNPSFQNPTGQVLNLDQRKKIIALAKQFPQTLFVEDAAYSELYFDKAYLDLVCLSSNIIHLGTFSKILAPGLRLGYMVGSKEIIYKLTLVKQSLDLHTNSLSQLLVNEILKDSLWFAAHRQKIRKFYQRQAQMMEKLLQTHLKNNAEWVSPQGGLFFWLKTKTNTQVLYKKAIKDKVAFIPGHVFFAKNPDYHYLRLSFATMDEEKMERGLKILGKLLSYKLSN